MSHNSTPLAELIHDADALDALDALTDSGMLYSSSSALELSQRLRAQGFSPSVASQIVTQHRLRSLARPKLGDSAMRMLFTNDAVEQATRARVATLHARHFQAVGAETVIDFGCGIGSDSLAFARAGLTVQAVELDDERYLAAQYNLGDYPNATVIHADAAAYLRTDHTRRLGVRNDVLWIDPARRKNGKRLYDPRMWQPSLDDAIEYCRLFSSAGIKVGPGIDYSFLPSDAHVEWISEGRSLLEAVIWLGNCAHTPMRTATMIDDDATVHHFTSHLGNPCDAPRLCEPTDVGEYIIEPDPAIIRSGGIASYAEQFELAPVSPGIAYLTPSRAGGVATQVPMYSHGSIYPHAQVFRIHSIHKINAKQLSKELRNREIGSVEIKKRGTDIEPQALRKALRLDKQAPHSCTIILTPILGQHRAIIASRVTSRAVL
ncbi:MAG: SAM-dependent methyltransferase [Actinomycetaceae bacterium]|nr:class I SAM-dependent methyltransferase [Arcanobacterium sp.]MDD7505343.1 SAM-dependent methyltransferase [Actinomycetaceae bacterium]MDY6143941.1 class I SAM-dependent methyltransferase [Arcanobacterium sp.]